MDPAAASGRPPVSSPARLQALRLLGFKSFAERTVVEFVPGINAVIGPNGSGKSNLADALRWALGEQGRALRSRRAEDVVFAGSERRSALGMADVALVLDNADGLVPVDYAVLEIGRRLFRSGENEYLVNRQRVRLRDLVDLLDAAHLADNAFLFIGQGMVDQALALRPEERRPLFEEVAGVRRHERRRRRAEAQLAEASDNLARVEDILAELRPQVRRLGAQAEQQVSRARTGEELAGALVAVFATRWREAAVARATAHADLAAAAAQAATSLAALHGAERRAADAAGTMAEHAAMEVERRETHESARAVAAALELQSATAAAEAAAIERDRARLATERAAAETALAGARRSLALPVPSRDPVVDDELAEVDRALGEARAEAAALRAADARRSEATEALRRAAVARDEELGALRRRMAAARQATADAEAARVAARERVTRAGETLDGARAALEAARAHTEAAERLVEDVRVDDGRLEAARHAAAEAASAARSRHAALLGRVEALRGRISADEGRGIAPAARKAGGRPLAGDLEIAPAERAIVAAALGELGRSFVVDRSALDRLAHEHGVVVVGEAAGPGARPPPTAEVEDARTEASRRAGGLLVEAVRADPIGVARRLLARWAWAPSLADAVDLAAALPPGWRVVARDGALVGADGVVAVGRSDAPLERRTELATLEAELSTGRAGTEEAEGRLEVADAAGVGSRGRFTAARRDLDAQTARRRAAEEAERRAARAAEQAARELAWAETRAAAAGAEMSPLAARLATLEAAMTASSGDDSSPAGEAGIAEALAAWETRIGELGHRHTSLAAARAAREAKIREIETERVRAESAGQAAEERLARVEAELTALADREVELATEVATGERSLVEAGARARAALAALEDVRAADRAGREELRSAEADVAAARDAQRRDDERQRAGEVRQLEARLALDAVREAALVEFAGLGAVGLRALDPGMELVEDDDEGAVLAAAVGAAGSRWAAEPWLGDVPQPGRIASLRRRFHELGTANPYAEREHAELRERVDGLDAQRADLGGAISRITALIAELDGLITAQFRATFAALEAAFDRRFGQLFGGGFARLSLTDPADLAETGVEIVARPPGKKAQALAMLSGGERALTAVALLFAMLEVRPVPFCVLDEVDAALDEANVGRFVEALRSLAETTQFIVITHNRGTIEAADALYGVTVGDDAVSRVVSLRIEEARTIAEQVGAAREQREPDAAAPAARG